MPENLTPDWSFPQLEGQLSVDIFRDEESLVIRSTVAGATLENLDIAIHGDLLTIRGERLMPEDVNQDDWFSRECYWGPFSRSLILPLDVYPERAQATLQEGLLTIHIPLRSSEHRLQIKNIESLA